MNFRLEDHSDEVKRELSSRIPIALEECGLVAEGYAKRLCPVDTGRLRNSISHTVGDFVCYIGTNVEYAPYVELGTSKTHAQPFIKPAVADHASEYKRIVTNVLKE